MARAPKCPPTQNVSRDILHLGHFQVYTCDRITNRQRGVGASIHSNQTGVNPTLNYSPARRWIKVRYLTSVACFHDNWNDAYLHHCHPRWWKYMCFRWILERRRKRLAQYRFRRSCMGKYRLLEDGNINRFKLIFRTYLIWNKAQEYIRNELYFI